MQKQNTLTANQVDTLLGGILKAQKSKWLVFWLFLGFGIVILGVGIFMCVKSRQLCVKSRQLFAAADGGAADGGKVNATRDASNALMADQDE